MKNLVVLCTLFLLTSCNDGKQTNRTVAETPPEMEILKAEVEAVVDSLNYAMVNPDRKSLENLSAETLSYGHSSGLIQNKDEFITDLVDGGFDFLETTITDQTIQIQGNTAIVRHIFSSEATNEGKPVKVKIGNLLVFQKEIDRLKLIARQAFKL